MESSGVLVFCVKRRLEKFLTEGHKIWDYRYNKEDRELYHHKGNVMDIYLRSLVPRYANRPNCYTRGRIDVPRVEKGHICTIKHVALAVIGVQSSSPPPPEKLKATSF